MNLSNVRVTRTVAKWVRDTLGLVLGVVVTALISLLADKEFVDGVLELAQGNPIASALIGLALPTGIAGLRAWQDARSGPTRT